ncbi:MAG: response regulator transcription factor [Verrucomicrobia bacterium]|nr:response regulator transcription factor [Verrucomicrobiota bacterium]
MKTTGRQQRVKTGKRILILDDHPMTRYGLNQLIDHEPDLMVCGEASNASQALAVIESARPDLVLADITMPGKSGLEFIMDMRTRYPDVAVLVISMHDENLYAERVLRAGGRGYIMKNEGGEKVLEAIRQVLQGQVYVSKSISAALLEVLSRHHSRASEATPGVLTNREFEVFQLIGQGLTGQQIGQRLNLSIKTVGTHRQHIKQKLKVQTGPELIRLAVRWAAAQQLI